MTRQDEEIKRLWKQGLGCGAISSAMGVTLRTVQRKIAKFREDDATGAPEKKIATRPDKVDAQWVMERLIDISLSIDSSAGPTQITALKAILDMLRAKETMPAEMSLAEKIAWLKRAMTPDEFIQVSEGWPADDRRKIYDRFAQEFQVNIDATNDVH